MDNRTVRERFHAMVVVVRRSPAEVQTPNVEKAEVPA